MKLQYYMRGLGIGIIVTAVIMGISLGGTKEKLNDEEIKTRAKELGMVENVVLSSINKETQSTQEEETIPSEPPSTEPLDQEEPASSELQSTEPPDQEEPASSEPQSTEPPDQEEPASSKPPSTEPLKTDETESLITEEGENETLQTENGTASHGEMVTITIKGGESSVSVSRTLADAGLVKDAKEYDKYLCENGYDKFIAVGDYQIPKGSSGETIAKVITKKLSFE